MGPIPAVGNGQRLRVLLQRIARRQVFAVERRKAWRMLQSKAGVENKDYRAQKALLAKVDKGDVGIDELKAKASDLLAAELAELN